MSTAPNVFDVAASSNGATTPTSSPSQGNVFDQAAAGTSSQATTTGPTDAQKAYRLATALGPYAPAGAAEKAMGQEMGDNKAQAKVALQSTVSGAGYTLAGITGSQIPSMIAETLPTVIPSTIAGVKAVGAWAEAHPFHAWALLNVLKEIVPGVKKAAGLVHAAPGE